MRRQLRVPIGVKMASSPRQTDRSQTRPEDVWQRCSRSRRDSVDPIRRTLIFGGSFIILGMLALVAPSFSTFEFSSDSKNRISLTAPCDGLP